MGETTQAYEEEMMENFMRSMGGSSGKSFTDPIPANYAMKRVERPESKWDEAKWKKSTIRESTLIPKGKAKSQYLLTDKDLLPLSYTKQQNSQGYNCMKMYNKREVERQSWEKYGRPIGADAAFRDHKNGVKLPSPVKPAVKKTKSSISEAKTAAKDVIVGTSDGRVLVKK
ncbi:hypothetical protein GALMADRAFT_228885 [Galerina marginata CBS 339.88]|uniref:XPA C-terminal domain-containing protein n=1 Tax=Galerina marginata (strain CBS 339.88) TaxID=685588 RepID=A0A067SNW8_GALM3|nr:hypothetical protein GALMADRAFT_228885 [Galerina marginata CBS 339.88]